MRCQSSARLVAARFIAAQDAAPIWHRNGGLLQYEERRMKKARRGRNRSRAMLNDNTAKWNSSARSRGGGSTVHMHLYVSDADKRAERGRRSARLLQPVRAPNELSARDRR